MRRALLSRARRASMVAPYVLVILTLALLTSAAPATAEPAIADLTTGLVAYYSFDDGTAKDTSGVGNDGVLKGGPAPFSGVSGKALLFDGIDDYVEVPNSSSLNPTQLTIAAWVNPLSLAVPVPYHKHYVIVNKEGHYQLAIFGEEHDGRQAGEVTYSINAEWPWTWEGGSYRATPNNYIHVALTVDSANKATLYTNGVKVGEKQYTLTMAARPSCLRIAVRGCIDGFRLGTIGFFKGAIDEVRIYNRALSQAEIQALYTPLVGGADQLKQFFVPAVQSNPLAP